MLVQRLDKETLHTRRPEEKFETKRLLHVCELASRLSLFLFLPLEKAAQRHFEASTRAERLRSRDGGRRNSTPNAWSLANSRYDIPNNNTPREKPSSERKPGTSAV